MDNFDLRKYLANNPLLNEGLIFEAISDDEIEKAAAAALNVSVDDIPDQEPTEEEKTKQRNVHTKISGKKKYVYELYTVEFNKQINASIIDIKVIPLTNIYIDDALIIYKNEYSG